MANINYSLGFTADTSQAKRQIQELQQLISNAMNSASMPKAGFAITDKVAEATQAAAQLKVQLEAATNVNTGKLDLTKFSQSLKNSGTSLSDYKNLLSNLGPEGKQAFASLANAITQAEVPLMRTNKIMNDLWISFKNTAKWQISSTALRAFTGAVQTAYYYAQDLNESLTNIRIVTQKSTDDMAEFAAQANKAAKALSSTTTDYTDAALIYYQQGLTDEEVIERTNTTVKMANVTGETAETVSDQLTAIWNNFYDGSKSIEYYADVITALGAATASSSDEIAEGLEKFSATAETVGLSYEYATASLATVVAETRQSADVVGTAFKTLFSRMEQLKMGETLDDGVTLGTYSEALDKIGVSILDANGELRAMDDILDDAGEKWKTLSDTQKVSTAQTVAGIRQYSQFLSLMNNWDKVQENIEIATGSEGTLQEQANIYAESWEAAGKRVQASAESIYNALIDDKFFIKLTDGFSSFLDIINGTIESLGGLKGVLTAVVALVSTFARDAVASGIKNIADNIKMLTKSGRESVEQLRKESQELLLSSTQTQGGVNGNAMNAAYREQVELQSVYIDNAKKLSDEEQRIAQYMMDQQQVLIKNIDSESKLVELNQKEAAVAQRQTAPRVINALGNGNIGLEDEDLYASEAMSSIAQLAKLRGRITNFASDTLELDVTNESLEHFQSAIKECSLTGQDFEKVYKNSGKVFDEFTQALNSGDIDAANDSLNSLWDSMMNENNEVNKLRNSLFSAIDATVTDEEANANLKDRIDALITSQEKYGASTQSLIQKQVVLTSYTSQTAAALEQLGQRGVTLGQSLVTVVGVLSSLAMAVQSVVGLVQTWKSDDLSVGEKLLSTFTTLGMVIPVVTRAISAENRAHVLNIALKAKALLPTQIYASTTEELATASASAAYVEDVLLKQEIKLIATHKALTATIKILEATTLAACAVALVAIIAIVKKASEAKDEAIKAYEEQIEKVDELKTELEEIEDKIDEINEKDSLSLVDQEEIKKLEQTKALLQAQIDLQEQIAKAKQKEQAEAIAENFSIDYQNLEKSPTLTKNKRIGYVQKEVTADEWKEGQDAYIKSLGLDSEKEAEKLAKVQEVYDAWILENENKTSEWLEKNGDSLEAAIDEYQTYLQAVSDGLIVGDEDKINDMLEIIKSGRMASVGGDEDQYRDYYIKPALDDEAVQATQQKIYEAMSSGTTEKGALALFGDQFGEDLSAYGLSASDVIGEIADKVDILKEKGISVTDLTADELSILTAVDDEMISTAKTAEDLKATLSEAKLETAKSNLESGNFSNLDDFYAAKQLVEESGGQVTGEQFAAALLNMSSAYENCTQEANNLNAALEIQKTAYEETDEEQQKYSDELVAEASRTLELAVAVNEYAEAYDFAAEELEEYAKQLKASGKYEARTGKELATLAKEQARYDRGVASAVDNMEDWQKAVKEANKGMVISADTLQDMRDAYGDILDIDGEELSEDFLINEENLNLMNEAMNGSEEAYDQLLANTREDISIQAGFDDSQFQEGFNDLMAKYYQGQSLDDIDVGASLDNQDFLDGLSQMVTAAGMTADQATSYLASMGVDAEVEQATQQVTEEVGINAVPHFGSAFANYYPASGSGVSQKATAVYPTISWSTTPAKGTRTVVGTGLKVTSASKSSGGNVKFNQSSPTTTGRGNTSGGGGGSSFSPKNDTADKSAERYHVVTNQIAALTSAYDDLDEAKDRAFGKDKTAFIERELELMDQQIEKQKEYKAEIASYRAEDWGAIVQYGFERDADGVITNYEEVFNRELQKWKDAENAYNAGTIDEDAYDLAQESFELFEELMDQYEETNDLYLEELESIAELEAEKLALKLEAIDVKVTAEVELSEEDLEVLDYISEKLEDRAFAAAERLAAAAEKSKAYMNSSDAYRTGINEIINNHEYGTPWAETEMEQLQDYRSAILETASSLNELKSELAEEFTGAFEEADEEIEKSADLFEHYSSLLDHYNNLVGLYGKNARGLAKEIAGTNRDNADAILRASQVQLGFLEQERVEAQKALDAATAAGDEALVDTWAATIDEVEQNILEAQEAVAENWANALEAAAEEFSTTVEDIITNLSTDLGGMYDSLDILQDQFDKEETLRENYLSASEQGYELSKLGRQIAASIGDVEGLANKQKLQNLLEKINKTYGKINDAQEYNVKMSEYELNYAQKQYELLLAEIALEDAQNNKTQMRLTRDGSGNYNYIYTADQTALDQAQQALEDAQRAIDELNEETLATLAGDLIENQTGWKDQLEGLEVTDFASIDEYNEEINRITDFYKQNEDDIVNQLDVLAKNMGLSGWADLDNAAVNAYEISGGVNGKAETTLTQLLDNFANYDENVLETSMIMGFNSVTDAVNNLQTASENVGAMSAQAEENLVTNTEEMEIYLANVSDTLVDWEEKSLAGLNQEIEAIETLVDAVNNIIGENGDYDISDIASFDSGGYTGAWGTSGKLGILHEKESVLTADDTSNILAAASLLRVMAPDIGNALAGTALQNRALIGNAISSAGVGGTDNTVQQVVSIEASFPGVQSAIEIENALNDIVNQAAQYASIKK